MGTSIELYRVANRFSRVAKLGPLPAPVTVKYADGTTLVISVLQVYTPGRHKP